MQVSLSLEGNGLGLVPAGLTTLSALRVLDLSANGLSALPPGPYLSSLEMISLASNRLQRVGGQLGRRQGGWGCTWAEECAEGGGWRGCLIACLSGSSSSVC